MPGRPALGQTWIYGWCADRDAIFQQVAEELQIALALDDNDSDVHRILAAVNLTRDDHDRAVYHQERGLALNPNYDLVVVQQGEFLTWLGRPEEGIDWIRKAMRLNPYHPERFLESPRPRPLLRREIRGGRRSLRADHAARLHASRLP